MFVELTVANYRQRDLHRRDLTPASRAIRSARLPYRTRRALSAHEVWPLSRDGNLSLDTDERGRRARHRRNRLWTDRNPRDHSARRPHLVLRAEGVAAPLADASRVRRKRGRVPAPPPALHHHRRRAS